MIVGNGFLAHAFESYRDDLDVCIFASGVSNSSNRDISLFEREQDLLEQTIVGYPEKVLVYFSTCSIYDNSLSDSLYVQHKIAMEDIIQSSGNRYMIFRISNPVGHTDNPNTILNYLVNNIRTQTPFTIWQNATRNLIDIDDLYTIVDHILQNRIFQDQIINIANTENCSILHIVSMIEFTLQVH